MEKDLKIPSIRPRFYGEVTIGPELIDRNGHVNNAKYLEIYEAQRELYIAAVGISLEEIESRIKLRPFVSKYQGRYLKPVFEGDRVSIHTAARDAISHLIFNQDMYREGSHVAYHNCTVWLTDPAGKPRKLPLELKEKLRKAKF